MADSSPQINGLIIPWRQRETPKVEFSKVVNSHAPVIQSCKVLGARFAGRSHFSAAAAAIAPCLLCKLKHRSRSKKVIAVAGAFLSHNLFIGRSALRNIFLRNYGTRTARICLFSNLIAPTLGIYLPCTMQHSQ
jgi:hypothetical protein